MLNVNAFTLFMASRRIKSRRQTKMSQHHPKKMNKGPTLLSCGIMEGDGWRDIRKCQIDLEQTTNNLDPPWTCLTSSEECQENTVWPSDSNPTSAVTSLIKELSLTDRNGHPTAPPSKRQCRSFSDELSSCRSPWKPSGSKVWTPVDKRRCHSGSSVQHCSNGVSTMQRSSSFSLPSRSNVFSFSYEPLATSSRSVCPRKQGLWTSPTFGRFQDDLSSSVASGVDLLRPLSVSHEQISELELNLPSNMGKSAANPEPAQPKSRLLRCRSQPCVHNDQKVGMKRRRPEEEQRPSLDLAKMTQNLRNFHSPTSVGATGNGCCQRKQTSSLNPNKAKTWASHLYVPSPLPGTTPACKPQHHGDSEKPSTSKGESSGEETKVFGIVKKSWPGDENDKDSWRRGKAGQDIFQLDGELDIEQIENN
ncbi:protein FAM53B isoform X2 [Scyliorhinus canicula]|uniref:protein FAM53B isoform X2 n=1 Tax=Scyliorhinus canicula TaxID=7830 RepID=UPI0018F5671D|nr:protein FAM53B isoform X2 [Scyliorhinus canicula]